MFYPKTPRFHAWPLTRPRLAAIYEIGVLEVEVHCDGDILSQTQTTRSGCADLHLQYPEAIAVETEGEGNSFNNP